jgi:hypothetical protein
LTSISINQHQSAAFDSEQSQLRAINNNLQHRGAINSNQYRLKVIIMTINSDRYGSKGNITNLQQLPAIISNYWQSTAINVN